MDTKSSPKLDPKPVKKTQKLAAALRANLIRRKKQVLSREELVSSPKVSEK